MFSGGVSEYVYGWETTSFGDLGGTVGGGNARARRSAGASAWKRRRKAFAPP